MALVATRGRPSHPLRGVIPRAAMACGAAIAAVFAGWLLLINFPQVAFRHCTSAQGIKLCSDKPLDDGQAALVLADTARRLSAAHLGWRGERLAIVAQEERLERLVFLTAYGGGGVNHYPYSSVAFVRPASIPDNRLIAPDGTIIAPPRTLSYFIAHEIAHGLYGEKIGPVRFFRAQRWAWEGAADFAAFGTVIDIGQNRRRLRDRDETMDYARSGLYNSYSSIVAFLVQRCGWTMREVLAAKPGTAAMLGAFSRSDCPRSPGR